MNQDRIQIEGKLADHAVVGAIPNTYPAVYRLYMVLVPERGLPYLVSQNLGSNRTAERAARAKQILLKRGTWVRVFAKTLDITIHHGTQTLFVNGITDVIPMNLPAAPALHEQEARDAG